MLHLTWQRWVTWWKSQSSLRQWAWTCVVVATILGSSYRLTGIRASLQFLGDQGRDAITAYEILQGDLVLLGPTTSVGSMYLGPLYYYFMAPWLLLAQYDPIGPALAVAVLGILTIPALYVMGRDWVDERAAVIATLLYASAPVVVEYVRFSWNPNPAPIVMLVMMWASWRAWRGKPSWWIVTIVMGIILIQLHYVALLAVIPAGLLWLCDVARTLKDKQWSRLKWLLGMVAVGLGLLLVAMSPLIAFDIRQNGILRAGFTQFLEDRATTDKNVSDLPTWLRIWREQHGRGMHVLFEIWGGKDWTVYYRQLNTALLGVYMVVGAWAVMAARNRTERQGLVFLWVVLWSSILGLAWYSGSVYHHYISYLFPISYLATGVVIVTVAKRLPWRLGVLPAAALILYMSWLSVLPGSLRYLRPMSWDIDDYRVTSEQILRTLPPRVLYTVANLSDIRDYRGLSYRYFLTRSNHPPVPFHQESTAEWLVIVADTPRDPERVMASPTYEVSSFPKGQYFIQDIPNGPRIYYVERAPAAPTNETNPTEQTSL